MVSPARAAVAPRVVSRLSGEQILLEDEVRECLSRRSQQPQRICIHGMQGSGKTVALRHLAAVFGEDPTLRFLDDPSPDEVQCHRASVVFTARQPFPRAGDVVLCQLAPWSEDDMIEYLLGRHRERCASVIRRLQTAGDAHLLHGVPELCRLVLDHMATDSEVVGARQSLVRTLRAHVSERGLLGRIQVHCHELMVEPGMQWPELRSWLTESAVDEADIRILRHFPVQVMLSAELLVRDLIREREPVWVLRSIPTELIEEAGARVARRHDLRTDLEQSFPLAGRRAMPLIASILHTADPTWRPARVAVMSLRHAHLQGVEWRGCLLSGSDCEGASFDGADLRRVDLHGATLRSVGFRKAKLSHAILSDCLARNADFSGADLSHVQASRGDFSHADFRDAECESGVFRGSLWLRSLMSDTNFVGADFTSARLVRTDVKRADFSGVDFTDAVLIGVELRETLMLGAVFRNAELPRCDLEGMILPEADFSAANLSQAKLTGSVMPDSCFRRALFAGAELADVCWERVSLRGADLRGARFHADTVSYGMDGRSGSGDPTQSEWERSRSQFSGDPSFLPPEAIRKANLCGADLRGAKIDGVDFYLVDLRYAKYDASQADQLRQTGAILQNYSTG